MSDLCRIKSGTFTLKDCVTLEEIEKKVSEGTVGDITIPTGDRFHSFAEIYDK